MEDEVWKECIFDFRDIPTKCDVCSSDKIRYTSNAEIYHGKQYGNGYCYLCDNCGASVGVHNTKNKKPLGRFATDEMKKLKMQCHAKFDPLWKKYNFKRTDCYGYLAYRLGLHLRETHFGWFDVEYLNKSLEILNDIDFKDMWKYIKERKERKREEKKIAKS